MNRPTMYGLRYLGMHPDYRALIEIGRRQPGIDRFARMNCSSTKQLTNPQALPHLPVPTLSETMEKFLRTVEPHLNETELANTRRIARNFETGKGRKLQELLEERARSKESWLADWWLENAYLLYRDPVVVYSSPGLIFPEKRFRSEFDRLTYAAKIISASLNYKQAIDTDQIPVEKFGKAELDMQQYRKIFGTCRIPGLEKDSLVFNPDSDYIIVMHKGNYFQVPVYGGDSGRVILSEQELVEQLQMCLTSNKNPTPIGLLTSDNRDNWGRAYQELQKDSLNRKSTEIIQKSLFTVSLDDIAPHNDGYYNHACHQLITGGGSKVNTGNRWYDKTIQFIIGEKGINGMTYEHSPAEGQPIAVLTDYILGYVKQSADLADTHATGKVCRPTKLDFNVTREIQDFITSASKNIDTLSDNLDMYTLEFKEYGKNFIKTQKMSPDSFIQIAMQYAFYRLHAVPGAHYESAQTRLFVHGRTETIRSCSVESVAFAKAMMSPASGASERIQKLREAVDAHKKYTMMAMNGRGVDRHMLGLKLLAAKHGVDVSELYSDPGYVRSAHMRLSTSQVASKHEAVMCYGPLVENGYGCCYNPRDNDMLFAISSFVSCSDTEAKRFGAAMKDSLMGMYQLLAAGKSKL